MAHWRPDEEDDGEGSGDARKSAPGARRCHLTVSGARYRGGKGAAAAGSI